MKTTTYLLGFILVSLLGACGNDSPSMPAADQSVDKEHQRDHDAGRDGPRLDAAVGDSVQGCEAQRTCRVGSSFADCGEGQAAVYCSPERCVWVSDGCPTKEFKAKLLPNCDCTGEGCPPSPIRKLFWLQRGSEEWTKDRSMVIAVTEDATSGSTPAVASCTGCVAQCQGVDNVCTGTPSASTVHYDTAVVTLHPGGSHGWSLEIEVDKTATPPKARICRLAFSDAATCTVGVPMCAESGDLKLQNPLGTGDLRGQFSATFADGLVVSGAF